MNNSFSPCARVQEDEKGNKVAMISLYPEFKDDDVITEMIFVVDRYFSFHVIHFQIDLEAWELELEAKRRESLKVIQYY